MYKALLVAPDGQWVTDYRGCKTKEEVMYRLGDQGSKWYFYPFEFIILDRGLFNENNRIIDSPYNDGEWIGRSIRTVLRKISEGQLDWVLENGGV